MDGFAQQLDIVLLQPLIKELGGNLDGQNLIFETNRLNRVEPCFERLATDVVFNDVQTIVPDGEVILTHNWVKFAVSDGLCSATTSVLFTESESVCKILINSRKKKRFCY